MKTDKLCFIFLIPLFLLFNTVCAFGTDWNLQNSGVDITLRAIWGSSATDVFIGGDDGTIIHYNGSDWSSPMETGSTKTIRGLWGSSANNVYAVGDQGTFLYYNGSGWAKIANTTSTNFNAIWGNSSSNMYIVGDDGTVLKYNGKTVSTENVYIDTDFNAIWGSDDQDIFIVGRSGTIIHYDGTNWSEFDSTDTTEDLKAVWGTSATDVFAVGLNGTVLHYGGVSWSQMSVIKTDYWTIGGTISPNIFAAGENGQIFSYSNGRWTKLTDTGTNNLLRGIWSSTENDTFIIGNNGTILFSSENRPAENTPPTALFTVTPESGTTETTFYVNAENCSDFQDTIDDLQVRWDWENDGTWDSEYTTTKLASHQYSEKGTYTVKLEVKDSGGLTDTITIEIIISKGGNKGCPASQILGSDDERIPALRAFRDQVMTQSAVGRACISMYYAEEATWNKLLTENPLIRQMAHDCLVAILPLIQTNISGTQ